MQVPAWLQAKPEQCSTSNKGNMSSTFCILKFKDP
jgi:hypothetical protein